MVDCAGKCQLRIRRLHRERSGIQRRRILNHERSTIRPHRNGSRRIVHRLEGVVVGRRRRETGHRPRNNLGNGRNLVQFVRWIVGHRLGRAEVERHRNFRGALAHLRDAQAWRRRRAAAHSDACIAHRQFFRHGRSDDLVRRQEVSGRDGLIGGADIVGRLLGAMDAHFVKTPFPAVVAIRVLHTDKERPRFLRKTVIGASNKFTVGVKFNRPIPGDYCDLRPFPNDIGSRGRRDQARRSVHKLPTIATRRGRRAQLDALGTKDIAIISVGRIARHP